MLSIGTKIGDLERRNGRYFALFRGIRPLPCTQPREMLATPMVTVVWCSSLLLFESCVLSQLMFG